MATGDVIGIINSDDVLADPAAIEKVVKCFERDETIDAVYADLYYVCLLYTSRLLTLLILFIIQCWLTVLIKPLLSKWLKLPK